MTSAKTSTRTDSWSSKKILKSKMFKLCMVIYRVREARCERTLTGLTDRAEVGCFLSWRSLGVVVTVNQSCARCTWGVEGQRQRWSFCSLDITASLCSTTQFWSSWQDVDSQSCSVCWHSRPGGKATKQSRFICLPALSKCSSGRQEQLFCLLTQQLCLFNVSRTLRSLPSGPIGMFGFEKQTIL
jgi:hypothetical protein